MSRLLFRLVLFVSITLVVAGHESTLVAQEADAATPEAMESQKRLDYMMESAAGFSGERSSDGAKVKFYDKPLLRFTNPVFGCREGLFFAWVDTQNRPVAVGQIFLMRNTENTWYIETQSVADCPIRLKSESNGSWDPSTAGIKWTKFEDAPRPSDTKPLRLAHMRTLAGRFHVEDSLVGEDEVLRLMRSPLIRYEDADKGVIDGALFAYVQATDPELLVQVEARKDKDGERAYYWALSAMTSAEIKASLDEKPVWSKKQSRGGASDVFYMRKLSGGVPFPVE